MGSVPHLNCLLITFNLIYYPIPYNTINIIIRKEISIIYFL